MKEKAEGAQTPSRPRRTGVVATVSSTEAQNSLGDLLERAAQGDRIVITRYGKRQAVILAAEDYDALLAEEEVSLEALEQEFEETMARIQTPDQARAVDALFQISGKELGEAARVRSTTDPDRR